MAKYKVKVPEGVRKYKVKVPEGVRKYKVKVPAAGVLEIEFT